MSININSGRHDNHPIELWSNKVIDEKINYVHNNPVKEDWCSERKIMFTVAQQIMPVKMDY